MVLFFLVNLISFLFFCEAIVQDTRGITKGNRPINVLGSTILGFIGPNLGSASVYKLTSTFKLAPTITYMEAAMQKLLKIDMGAKKAPQSLGNII